jgi:tetratricopeptide (TPR) repeat protein
MKKHFGEDHIEYAKTLGSLSNLLSDLGDYDGAKKQLLKVLEIMKKHYGEDHVEYAKTLHNLSNYLSDLGDYEGAK